jgi:membrane protein YdbS with pleckstrin-like domain
MSSHGNLSLSFMMKVMVYHFVNDFHEVTIAFIVVLLIIVVVEIFLHHHQVFF